MMQNDKTMNSWMDGFMGQAEAAGLKSAEAVQQLLKAAGRLDFLKRHPDEFQAGYTETVKQAGLTKQSISLKALGMLLAGGAGMYGAQQGFASARRGMGMLPMDRMSTDMYDIAAAKKRRDAIDMALKGIGVGGQPRGAGAAPWYVPPSRFYYG